MPYLKNVFIQINSSVCCLNSNIYSTFPVARLISGVLSLSVRHIMACKVGLLLFLVYLSFAVCSTGSSQYDYCVVGAGPGGKPYHDFLSKATVFILIF